MKIKIPTGFRSAMAETQKVIRDPRLVLWSLFVIFFPFYVFSSGLPQPADWLLLILAPVLLKGWSGRLPPAMARPYRALVIFAVYTIVVNLVWSLILGSFTIDLKDGFLLSPMFYIYNSLMFLTFLLMSLRYGDFLLWLTGKLVLISTLVQVALSFITSSNRHRATLLFNNPNQLGYYALLSACILLLAHRKVRMSMWQLTLGLITSSYLALMSASKAALATVAMLSIALVLGRIRTMMVAGVAFTILISTSNPFSDALDRAQQRITDDQSKNFVEERGYDRILNNPEYCVVGAGEGGYRRFADTTALGGSHEIHSSGGTLIFCYGIMGTLLFGVFLWMILWGSGIRTWIVVGPAFAYGMTHQGLRFTFLWVLLGIAVALRMPSTQAKGTAKR